MKDPAEALKRSSPERVQKKSREYSVLEAKNQEFISKRDEFSA